jgi:hypothetical protein
MTPEMKEISLKALRSGEFFQTQYKLSHRLGISYCCIGVMAKVNGCFPETNMTGDACERLQIDVPLNDAAKKFLQSKIVDYDPPGTVSTVLVDLNDLYGWNFEQIADFVEVAV